MDLLKPFFLYRPRQYLKRLARTFQAPEPTDVELPWDVPLRVNPQEAVGNAIWRTSVHEIATTEVLCRLMPRGGTAVDVGANIGYFTSLMAARAGNGGRVLAFEAHPDVFQRLHHNVNLFQNQSRELAEIEPFGVALSDSTGTSTMALNGIVNDVSFNDNEGIARLSDTNAAGVKTKKTTLDAHLQATDVDLLKIDVEGHEPQVLKGAPDLIKARRIKNIVFEEHEGSGEKAKRLLFEQGYAIYELSWSVRKPLLLTDDDENKAIGNETPNFLATLQQDRAERLFQLQGWKCLDGV